MFNSRHFCVNGNAAVVANLLVAASGVVEQRCLAAVWVAYQRHVYCFACALHQFAERLGCKLLTAECIAGIDVSVGVGHNLDKLGLAMPQRHMVAKQFVLDRPF